MVVLPFACAAGARLTEQDSVVLPHPLEKVIPLLGNTAVLLEVAVRVRGSAPVNVKLRLVLLVVESATVGGGKV